MRDNFCYSGDAAWSRFAKNFESPWQEYNNKAELLDILEGDELLAMVISRVEIEPKRWLRSRIPALSGKTPLWCLKHNRKNQLKAMLMHMHF